MPTPMPTPVPTPVPTRNSTTTSSSNANTITSTSTTTPEPPTLEPPTTTPAPPNVHGSVWTLLKVFFSGVIAVVAVVVGISTYRAHQQRGQPANLAEQLN